MVCRLSACESPSLPQAAAFHRLCFFLLVLVSALTFLGEATAQLVPPAPAPRQSAPAVPASSPSGAADILKPETRPGLVILEAPQNSLIPGSVGPERLLPPEVNLKLREFQVQRERYLRQREQLLKEAQGATESEREKIRERFKQLQDEWRRASTELREPAERQRSELQEKLREHKRLLEARREALREKAGDRRRGTD